MSNPFSKLKIKNIIYDVKDAIARANIGDLSSLQTEHKDNLVEAINEAAQNGGGVTWLTTSSTSAEIEAAYNSGNAVGVIYQGMFYYLTNRGGATLHRFTSKYSNTVYGLVCNNNEWSTESRYIPIATQVTARPLGTASAGSSSDFAKGDHIHPMPSASDVGAVASNQGSSNAGKVLGIGNDGTVTPVDGDTGVSDSLKLALLQIASKVAYIDANGQSYYDGLFVALYPSSAVTISNTLTNCSTSNHTSAILIGSNYSATITADDGYSLSNGSVTITMDGVDITSTAYSGNYNKGIISINNVSANIEINITASAESVPTGYTRYDYIYNTGTLPENDDSIINTGINSIYCDPVYIHEIELATINQVTGTNNGCYGCRNATGSAGAKNGNSLWMNNSDKIAIGYNGVDSGYTLNFAWGTKHKIKLDTGKIYIDDVLVLSPSATRTSYNTSAIRLFGVATNESSYAATHGTIKFYSVKITDSTTGVIVAKLVPCKDSNNIPGVYDFVAGAFRSATNHNYYGVENEV